MEHGFSKEKTLVQILYLCFSNKNMTSIWLFTVSVYMIGSFIFFNTCYIFIGEHYSKDIKNYIKSSPFSKLFM